MRALLPTAAVEVEGDAAAATVPQPHVRIGQRALAGVAALQIELIDPPCGQRNAEPIIVVGRFEIAGNRAADTDNAGGRR